MKNNVEKEEIDLCSFEELWDEDGDKLFKENLVEAFKFLSEENLLKDKKQKYVFLVSKISYKGGISRYEKERKGTILKFLRYWGITFQKPFSEDLLQELLEKERFNSEMEMYRKQAERNSAWGQYGAIIRSLNEDAEYKKANRLPSGQKEEELKRLNNRSNMLIIGG